MHSKEAENQRVNWIHLCQIRNQLWGAVLKKQSKIQVTIKADLFKFILFTCFPIASNKIRTERVSQSQSSFIAVCNSWLCLLQY
jgi:hypothetical protein